MNIGKSHKIAVVIIIIAALIVAENTLLRPASVFKYTGIQIYDAIRDYGSLESRGFDVIVTVEGDSNNLPLRLEGRIVETRPGWFTMNSGNMYRIVEGPMGSKDILASFIYFNVSPGISVEAVFGPEKGENFAFRPGFRRVKGSIAFDNADIPPTLLQELRNSDQEFYSITFDRIEITPFKSGFIMDIKVPVRVSEIEGLVSKIENGNFQTGNMYYYTSADDENDIPAVRQNLEEMGAVLVNYYKQR